MKKIIFFAYDLNIGGIEKSLINLLNELVNFYNVTLVLEKNEGSLKRDLSKKVKIIEHKVYSFKIIPIRKSLNLIRRLLFIIKHKNNYDFSCAYTPYLYSAIKLSKICSKNNSIYIHSDYTNIYNQNEILNFFDTRNIKNFKNIIFVSKQSKENFLKYYPELTTKCKVINNIVNVEEIKNKSKEPLEIKIEKEDIIFAFVGRLEEESKRITRLLNCFKILIRENKNIKLWIIGDGKDYFNIKEYIKDNDLNDNITMMGMHSNPYKFMIHSNYIIITSDYEGFPVVFNESAILNKPILSTLDISDEYYKITDSQGFIIPKEPKLMANKIKEIIKINFKIKYLDFNDLNKKRINKIKELIED